MKTIPKIETCYMGGSRVYGTPRPDSDTDIAMLVNAEAQAAFFDTCDVFKKWDNGTISFRFGNLNLITMVDPKLYARWKLAFDRLVSERPVSKERACEVHLQEGATNVKWEGHPS